MDPKLRSQRNNVEKDGKKFKKERKERNQRVFATTKNGDRKVFVYNVLDIIEGLTSRCKQYSNPKYEYKDFIKLSDIRESQPSGYIVRLAFYAQGTRNAHVLLSRSTTPNLATEPVYEFSE